MTSRSFLLAAALACLPVASLAAPTVPIEPPPAAAKTAPAKADATPSLIGKAAPDFTRKDLDGKDVKLSIDNSPDAEKRSAEGGTLINYVDAAVEAVTADKAVEAAQTKAYGCGVKYGS